jgi:hypothetical protein
MGEILLENAGIRYDIALAPLARLREASLARNIALPKNKKTSSVSVTCRKVIDRFNPSSSFTASAQG